MQILHQIRDEICEEGDCTSPAVAIINHKMYCARHGGYLLVPSSSRPAPRAADDGERCPDCGHKLINGSCPDDECW